MDAFAVAPVLRPEVRLIRATFLAIALGAALWLASRYNYLLFHSIAEIFGICVAVAVFMFSWNSREDPQTRVFVILGISYLFVAGLELVHTLSYSGMNVLPVGQDYATKLWVAARGVQALGTLAFVILARVHRTAPHWVGFSVIGVVSLALVLSIFRWGIFPLCFVEGQGVTLFKKAAEYGICVLLAASVLLLTRKQAAIPRQERNLLIMAILLNIASELVFTLYVSAYGYQNLIGHYLMIGSFFLAYQALFASEVRKRITTIGELERSKARLEASEAELRAVNQSKDKFFSILAHDLRNPLSGVLTIAELLATRSDQIEPARMRELSHLLHDGARQGVELLESILHWARAQTGRLQLRPSCVRLSDLCQGVAAAQKHLADGKGIVLRSCCEQDACAFADEDTLATVLRNLLSNAIKFTPEGGEIVISAGPQGEWARLSVADTGVGMAVEDQKKLFRIDVHFTTEGTNAERGNGMGLILCKELVELNKGIISVQSERGRGTTFDVLLPRSEGCHR